MSTYYISFDDNYHLVVSAYQNITPEHNYTPIKYKTLATINAFLVLLNLGDSIKPLLDGYTIKTNITDCLFYFRDDNKTRDLIKKTRYHCYLNNIYCSIITKDNYGLCFKDYQMPYIPYEQKIIEIGTKFYEYKKITDAISNIKNYIIGLNLCTYQDIDNTPNGGLSWLMIFRYDFSPRKDKNFLRLLGELKKACEGTVYKCLVDHTKFRENIVIQLCQYYNDPYIRYNGVPNYDLNKLSVAEINNVKN
jgi:hypothetical protein